jgi:hypothetical protein
VEPEVKALAAAALLVLAVQTAAEIPFPVQAVGAAPAAWLAAQAVCSGMEQMALGVLAIRRQPQQIRAREAVVLLIAVAAVRLVAQVDRVVASWSGCHELRNC